MEGIVAALSDVTIQPLTAGLDAKLHVNLGSESGMN